MLSAIRCHRYEIDRVVRGGHHATPTGGIGSGFRRRVAHQRDRAPFRLIKAALYQLGHTPPACPARYHGMEPRPGSAGQGPHRSGRRDRPVCHFRGAFRARTQSAQAPIGSVTNRSAPLACPHCLVYPACFRLHNAGYNIAPVANQQRHNVRGSRVGCLTTRNRPESFHGLSQLRANATGSKFPDSIHNSVMVSKFVWNSSNVVSRILPY